MEQHKTKEEAEAELLNLISQYLAKGKIYSRKVFMSSISPKDPLLKKISADASILNPWFAEDINNPGIIKHLIADYIETKLEKETFSKKEIFEEISTFKQFKDVDALSQTITNLIKRKPFSYKFYFPLTNFNNWEGINDIKISKSLDLKRLDLKVHDYYLNFLGGSSSFLPKKITTQPGEVITITGQIKGYVSQHSYRPTETIESSIMEIQILIGLLDIFNILEDVYTKTNIDDNAVIFTTYKNNTIVAFDMETDILSFLSKKQFNSSITRYENIIGETKLLGNLKEDIFVPIQNFFVASGQDDDLIKNFTTKIGNAVIWYLYGISSANPKKGIINLITSLESLIRNTNGNLHGRAISEICGVLLGSKVSLMTGIQERITEIYKLRNALVHTGKARIGNNEKDLKIYNREDLEVERLFLAGQIKELIKMEINKL
ncbi:hypothetical protein KBH77_02715 [Patescibacteria group bacterium]|nr:hypothetical protein [Patescibacteria group bacterium]HQA87777.1 HEPN domain-containing protein [Candidatus Dojkabacteria bacterium]